MIPLHRSAARTLAGLVAVTLFAALPAVARAAGPKRAGVPKFDGAQEALIRKQVMQALKAHGYELAKSREMEGALQNTGALLESDDGFQKVAKELSLTVIVTGEVGKKRAKITIHDGREGSVLGEGSFPGANPKKIAAAVGKNFWNQLGADIARGHVPSGAKKPQKVAEAPEDDESAPDNAEAAAAPPPPESKPKKENAEAAAAEGESNAEGEAPPPPKKKKKKKQAEMQPGPTEEDDTSGGSGTVPPTVELGLVLGGVNRSLAYNQVATGNLRPYSLPFGFQVALQAVLYPLALFTDSAVQNLGVELGLEQGFLIKSSIGAGDTTFTQGASFGTTVHEFAGGLRFRIPFGLAGHQVWFSLTGGEHAFLFTGREKYAQMNPPQILDIPDTIYRYVRPGLGARFELPYDLAIGVGGGYRLLLDGAGTQFKQFFPHASIAGLDAEAYVGYRVLPIFEVRLAGELRRYFSSMHSVAGDAFEAGGAVDQYLSFGAEATVLLGGSGRPAPAEEEAPPPPKKKKKHHRDSDEDQDDSGGGGGDDSGGGGGGDADK